MIVFRVDSSAEIGSGHLMRCLTLAGQLKKERQEAIAFISRELEGNLNHLIEQSGYQIYTLSNKQVAKDLIGYEIWMKVKPIFDANQTKEILQRLDVTCLIIDHYAIDEKWENIIRPCVRKIMVIDDLANRKHNCDVLLDQNYNSEIVDKYKNLVPARCKCFLGLRYVLLRDEFIKARQNLRNRDGQIKNVLVFFGGSDPTNETLKVLFAIKNIKNKSIKNKSITVDVVVGEANPQKEKIKVFCDSDETIKYYCQVNNMAELMQRADLAVGAKGSTTWERCFLGVPSVLISIAKNQIQDKKYSGDGNLPYIDLGWHQNISAKDIQFIIERLIGSPKIVQRLGSNASRIFTNWQGNGELLKAIVGDNNESKRI